MAKYFSRNLSLVADTWTKGYRPILERRQAVRRIKPVCFESCTTNQSVPRRSNSIKVCGVFARAVRKLRAYCIEKWVAVFSHHTALTGLSKLAIESIRVHGSSMYSALTSLTRITDHGEMRKSEMHSFVSRYSPQQKITHKFFKYRTFLRWPRHLLALRDS